MRISPLYVLPSLNTIHCNLTFTISSPPPRRVQRGRYSTTETFFSCLLAFFVSTSIFYYMIAGLIRMPPDSAQELFDKYRDPRSIQDLAAIIYGNPESMRTHTHNDARPSNHDLPRYR